MGNVAQAFAGAVLFYYFKIMSKINPNFSEKGGYNSNSTNEGLLEDNRNFETITIQTNATRNLGTTDPNANAKNEYQLLKNSEEIDYKNEKENKEFEDLQQELKSIDLDVHEVVEEKEEKYIEITEIKKEDDVIIVNNNSNSQEGKHVNREDDLDDLKAEILNEEYQHN